MAMAIKDCPLCGSPIEVPQYKPHERLSREVDEFYLKCKRAGLTAKHIANLTGATRTAVQRRLDRLAYDV